LFLFNDTRQNLFTFTAYNKIWIKGCKNKQHLIKQNKPKIQRQNKTKKFQFKIVQLYKR
jgi:hypothetical protein